MEPTVGRIVHFHSDVGGEPSSEHPQAAIIVGVGERVTVRIFPERGNDWTAYLPLEPDTVEPGIGSWRWPPRA